MSKSMISDKDVKSEIYSNIFTKPRSTVKPKLLSIFTYRKNFCATSDHALNFYREIWFRDHTSIIRYSIVVRSVNFFTADILNFNQIRIVFNIGTCTGCYTLPKGEPTINRHLCPNSKSDPQPCLRVTFTRIILGFSRTFPSTQGCTIE